MSASETSPVGLPVNPYLFEIEELRKRRAAGRLAHDFGAGAPCLRCGDRCPGFDLHFWRKVCKNCRCGKEDHDIPEEEDPALYRIGRLFGNNPSILARYSKKANQTSTDRNIVRLQERYEWMPPAATSELMQRFFSALPSDKQPLRGSEGGKYRRHQLERQLPEHDFDVTQCDRLSEAERQSFEKFVDRIKRKALGIGVIAEIPAGPPQKCEHCSVPMKPGEVAVTTERLPNHWWHPGCFVCEECGHLLADLIHFAHAGQVFCGRHYAEKLKPRCAACDELVFSKEYTFAENQNWHLRHFCCWQCDTALGGQRYVAKDAKPFCLACCEKLFAKDCAACHRTIDVESRRISHNNHFWHHDPACFQCTRCYRSLIGAPFLEKEGILFCSSTCKRDAIETSM